MSLFEKVSNLFSFEKNKHIKEINELEKLSEKHPDDEIYKMRLTEKYLIADVPAEKKEIYLRKAEELITYFLKNNRISMEMIELYNLIAQKIKREQEGKGLESKVNTIGNEIIADELYSLMNSECKKPRTKINPHVIDLYFSFCNEAKMEPKEIREIIYRRAGFTGPIKPLPEDAEKSKRKELN